MVLATLIVVLLMSDPSWGQHLYALLEVIGLLTFIILAGMLAFFFSSHLSCLSYCSRFWMYVDSV